MRVERSTSADVRAAVAAGKCCIIPSWKTRGLPLSPLVAVLALAVGLSAHATEPSDAIAMKAAQIAAVGITVRALGEPAAATGLAYPARVVLPRASEQLISAAVSGTVEQVLVEDHASVTAGQPLIRLNSPEFGALQLGLLEATNRARVADSTLTREKALVAEGLIPARRVLEAQAAASNARAAVQQSRAAIRLAGADDATVARIAAGSVQERLTLRASQAGTVLEIDVKPGQHVADAAPLLRIAELATLWLDIDLPAAKASDWDPAGTLQVVGRDARARPLSISAQVGGAQTSTLRAEITDGATRLRPGEFVQVQVPLRLAGDAWSVPNAAVIHHAARTVVFVRTPTGFVARDVRVIGESQQGLSMAGPLTHSDRIAVAGTIALKAAWLGVSGADE